MNFGLDEKIAKAIMIASEEVAKGKLNMHFPLKIWQTGSGTHSNMNANEVIANRAIEILGGKLGDKLVHPNDHVNRSQSSNDCFPTVMHMATVIELKRFLFPSLELLHTLLRKKSEEFKDFVFVGIGNGQEGSSIDLGHEFSKYAVQVEECLKRIKANLPKILELAQGGTAIGTGLNTYIGFAEEIAKEISKETGYSFTPAKNMFSALSNSDSLIEISGSLNTLAVCLMKIANDIIFLGLDPISEEAKLSEIKPGSLMTSFHCEAMKLVCAQVMGNHIAATIGGATGHFELNVFKPLIMKNVLHSIKILGDASRTFAK